MRGMAHSLVMLTTDTDFVRLAEVQPLALWQP